MLLCFLQELREFFQQARQLEEEALASLAKRRGLCSADSVVKRRVAYSAVQQRVEKLRESSICSFVGAQHFCQGKKSPWFQTEQLFALPRRNQPRIQGFKDGSFSCEF